MPYCPNCGAGPLAAQQKFCGQCGTRLAPSAAPVAPAPQVAQTSAPAAASIRSVADVPIHSCFCGFTTNADRLPEMGRAMLEAGIPESQIAWFVDGRPHETDKVANRRARAAIVQTAPTGPQFTLPLDRYDGGIEAQIHLPETYTSTGFERCQRCVRERATQAEEVVVKTIVCLSDLIANSGYLQTVEESIRHALAGRRGYEDLMRCIGQKRLKLALKNPHLLTEIGSHEELLDVLINATQQRWEQEFHG